VYICVMRRVLWILIFCMTWWPASSTIAAQTSSARPFVQLEKKRFAATENVFFWIGWTADSSIPTRLEGRVFIVRPDGSQKIMAVSPPADRMTLASSSKGGWGLGEMPEIGRYDVAYEIAGRISEPVPFVVEDVPLLRDIVAGFSFPSPLDLTSTQVVTFTVRNGTREVIRFPRFGGTLQGIDAGMIRTTPPRFSSLYIIPASTLDEASGLRDSRPEGENISWDHFTWDILEKVQTVTIKPGDTYRLDLPVSALLPKASVFEISSGEYDLRLSTNLKVLIGEPGGAWADLSPVRIPVNSSAHAVVK
jgi:hypothetical protein